MLAVRHGERALPLLWRVEATQGTIRDYPEFRARRGGLIIRRSSPL
jgi:2,3-bisphosphoglycerate-independent phosphoglycerate mutase